MALTSKLSAIGDAIRAKAGTTTKYTLANMPTAIKNIPSGATTLIGKWCEGTMTSVTTSDVTSVNTTAKNLFGATKLELNQPNIKFISDSGLASATPLTSVTLDGVTSVGKRAFQNCTGLVSASLNACNDFSKETFSSCTKLQTVSINSCTSLSDNMFSGCSALTTLNAEKLTAIRSSMFNGFAITTVNTPACTSVGDNAFRGCTDLPSIDLPSCTSIGQETFSGCRRLTSINAPKCTTLGGSVFQNCYLLASVYLGALTTSFSTATFYNCYSLTSLIISNTSSVVAWTNDAAFNNCYHLTGTTEDTYNPTGAQDCYIYVPDALVDSYKTADRWSDYASQIKPLSEYTG